jgi:hypothetical protein
LPMSFLFARRIIDNFKSRGIKYASPTNEWSAGPNPAGKGTFTIFYLDVHPDPRRFSTSASAWKTGAITCYIGIFTVRAQTRCKKRRKCIHGMAKTPHPKSLRPTPELCGYLSWTRSACHWTKTQWRKPSLCRGEGNVGWRWGRGIIGGGCGGRKG